MSGDYRYTDEADPQALRAEVTRLTQERDTLRNNIGHALEAESDRADTAEAALAVATERERGLREALADSTGTLKHIVGLSDNGLMRIAEKARYSGIAARLALERIAAIARPACPAGTEGACATCAAEGR